MKLRFLSNILTQQEGASKIACIACSSNGNRTAIACANQTIELLDEHGNQKDRFATKPIDTKFGKKSYSILSVVFSPDSSKIAVAQSDNVVFIYKIGFTWNEKKVIVNKLPQSSTVTALSWPFDDKLLIGLLDGKVRIGLIKTNKCSSLYKTDQAVVSMETNPKKTAFVTAHQDGSIILYNFSSKSQSRICTLQIPPYCMVFTNYGLVVAGSDRRIFSYTENGVVQQQFDYSDQDEKEFSAIACDPTAQNVVVASFDRIRLFSWSTRRGAWDEGAPLEIKNAYAITSLGWKGDGSVIYAGTLCGGVFSVDCCLRRGMLKSRFETTYVAPSHVIVRDVTTEAKTSVISNKGLAIDELKIMGRDRFVVGYTSSSLVLADTELQKCSEIEWQSGGHEKFYFDFPNVCLIINAGEITVIEYGIDGALGWVRTELTSPHLLSVRIADSVLEDSRKAKKLAYLVDPNTISILNLNSSQQTSFITHSSAIDWIELNEAATKLLFRDKRSKVSLFDIATDRQSVLLSFCTYVQWVPMSDVIVAQSGDVLSIWYNPDLPEQVSNIKIKGEVEAVLRDVDRTEVIVQEPNAKVAYELDGTQIEFGAALEKRDFERAMMFLENNPSGPDSYTMWSRVAELALENQKLFVAQRCYAALNDVARAVALHKTIEIAEEAAARIGGDGTHYYKVRANLARMGRKFKEAEKIYIEQNDVDSAIDMYTNLQKWDEALELAKATSYSGYDQLRTSYLRALNDTGQDSKAADLKVSEGDSTAAVQLYLKANKPIAALNTCMEDPTLAKDDALLRTIATALLKNQIYDRAGEVFEKLKDFEDALDCYQKGYAFAKAVQLARFAFPEKVVELEEKWGDHLTSVGQFDAAINHFLEANKSQKAVESAIKAKEWSKAVQIVDVIQEEELSKKYYGKIADHYASVGEFDRAERLFIEADLHKLAIAMYIKNGRWADAYRLSEEFLGKEETLALYAQKAQELEDVGRFAEAEQLYISIGESAKAIQMYRKANRDEDVLRLVEKYHGDRLQETHKRLALDYEERGDMRAAEEEYLKAGDWKAAVNMYAENEMWSDAHRIAKSEGGDAAQKQICFLWAKSLGGDAAVKLLNKFAMLSEAIDYACESGAYDFAFDLTRIGAKERLPEVHARMGVQLEEDGRLEDAAKHYISAGKAEEAVAMFIHDKDWAAAEKIASEHAPNSLPDVYTGEARKALEEGDHARAESFLLRANKPDVILKYFKENNMWPDALRIAREYLPHQLSLLQEEFEKSELRSGARGVESYLAQAKEWESQADWGRAVIALLKINSSTTEDEDIIVQSVSKAADIVIKFLLGNEEMVQAVLEALQDADCHEKAGELLLHLGQTRQAIQALCEARQWGKAKQIAAEYLPEIIPEIERQYKESLKNEGRLGELIDVDVITAIDLLIERDQWDKALETAKQQNHRPLLDKYVAQYAAFLLQRNEFSRILGIFEKYGASGNSANFSIYKKILDETIAQPKVDYKEVSKVRDMFLEIYRSLKASQSEHEELFLRYLWAVHLFTMRTALEPHAHLPEVPRLRLRQAISLLRYSDLLPADRLFYEAGVAAKEFGGPYENLGFLLLNHYLDLVDAIEEGNGELVDYSVLEETDIPTEVPLPTRQWLQSSDHEEVKEWVLAASVDDGSTKKLIFDKRGMFEGSLANEQGQFFDPCIITGYPVIETRIDIGDMCAEKEDLNRFLIIIKANPTDCLMDTQSFASNWAGSPLSIAL